MKMAQKPVCNKNEELSHENIHILCKISHLEQKKTHGKIIPCKKRRDKACNEKRREADPLQCCANLQLYFT